MSHKGLTVRSLDPDRVPEVARLHCEIFARSPSGRLGPHYVEALLRWFLAYDGAIVLGAEDSSAELAGYAFGAPPAYSYRMRGDLRGTVAGALVRRPWALLDSVLLATMAGYVRQVWRVRATAAAGVARPPPPEAPSRAWNLVAIAVAPSHRGSSIGRRLLSEFEDRSRRLGASELSLTVTLDNLSARRFYDRSGWEPGPPQPDGTMTYAKRLLGPDGQE